MKLRDYVLPGVLSLAATVSFASAGLAYRDIKADAIYGELKNQDYAKKGSFGVMAGVMFSAMALLDLSRKKDLEKLLKDKND